MNTCYSCGQVELPLPRRQCDDCRREHLAELARVLLRALDWPLCGTPEAAERQAQAVVNFLCGGKYLE